MGKAAASHRFKPVSRDQEGIASQTGDVFWQCEQCNYVMGTAAKSGKDMPFCRPRQQDTGETNDTQEQRQ